MWCSVVSIDKNDSRLGTLKPPLENYPSETLSTSSPSFQATRAKSTYHMIHLKIHQWFSPYVLVLRWPGDISCSCLLSWDCMDFSNVRAVEKKFLCSGDAGEQRSWYSWARINTHGNLALCKVWHWYLFCTHLWSTLGRNSANVKVNVFSWGCERGMGSESKEKGLWTLNMQEVSSQCSFCEAVVEGAGKQELRDRGCVWSSRGLGNKRTGNPVVHELRVLAWRPGTWSDLRRGLATE